LGPIADPLCTLKYTLGFHTRCGISMLSLANISLSSSTSLHDVSIVPVDLAVSCVATPVLLARDPSFAPRPGHWIPLRILFGFLSPSKEMQRKYSKSEAYTDIYVSTQRFLFNTTLFCAWLLK